MSITKIRSGVTVSGSLKTLDTDTNILTMIKLRLRRQYGEADQRVFANVIHALVATKANQLSDEKFHARLKQELLKQAQVIYPDRQYNDRTDYAILYHAILDFMDERHDKIAAYQRNK